MTLMSGCALSGAATRKMNSKRGTFMRRFLLTLCCLAVLSTAAFAQDDHNDAGAILVGYSVVTATSNGATGVGTGPLGLEGGLIVFETFGLRTEVPALRAGVLPATMTTRMVLFASSGIRLSRNVGVGITNPQSGEAVVKLTLRRANGAVTSTKTLTIPAHQQVARFISELFGDVPDVLTDFDGTLTITTDTPVAIVALRFRGTKFSTIPITSLSPSISLPEVRDGVGGSNAVLLPQFVADGGWAAETIILNNGTGPITVRLDLYNQDGTPMLATLNHQRASSFQNLVIPAGGLIQFSPRNVSGDSDF
jgi:hypothetical protein